MPDRDPATQYQVGDHVLYKPAGIYTRIKGYLWCESVSSAPVLIGYILECGVTAPDAFICRCDRPQSVVEVPQATLDELLRQIIEIRKAIEAASTPLSLGKVAA